MKKITYVIFLFIGVVSFAQQPQSYTDLINSETEFEVNEPSSAATIIHQRQPIVDTYTNDTDFDNAVAANCTGVLTDEDFTGGPVAITDCGPIVSSAGDACYAPGELEDGFDVQASVGTNVVSIPAGAIGNVDPLVGAISFAEFTIVNFNPPVYAVSMDIWENIDPNTDVRIYGGGGALIDSFLVNTPIDTQTFFGFISDEPVEFIELEGQNASGELIGNLEYGADCSLSLEDNLASQISIFPNPAKDVLNVNVRGGIEVQNVVLYDILGKQQNVQINNGQINISNLTSGVYILNLVTNSGTLTQKIVKL